MTKQIKVKDHKEKEEFNKLISTHQTGKEPTIIVDQFGLALLLMTVYGQKLCGVDWKHDRGEMFYFVDNPTVRSCVVLWRESIRVNEVMGDDVMSLTERYLFNLLDYESYDAFHELQNIEMDQRAWRKEVRNKIRNGQIKTAQATEQGDNSNE